MGELRDEIARALYEHWVEEDFNNEYAGWDSLLGKDQWLERADRILAIPRLQEALSPQKRLHGADHDREIETNWRISTNTKG